MSIFLQDVFVTMVSVGAMLTVAWRVVGVIKPRARAPRCGACAACGPKPTLSERAGARLTFLRSRTDVAATSRR